MSRKNSTTETRPLHRDEAALLLSAENVPDKRDRMFFACMLYTGRRMSEVLVLKWEDIFDTTGIKIWVSKQKRYMVFNKNPELLRVARECYEGKNGFIFLARRGSTRRKPISGTTANEIILKPTFKRLGIQTRNPSTHCLRKTFGVNYVRTNAPKYGYMIAVKDLQEYWGHATLDRTIRYLGFQEDMVKERANNLSYF